MPRYEMKYFVGEEDTSSVDTLLLTDTATNPHPPIMMHVRQHTDRATSLWRTSSKHEKILLVSQTITIIVLIVVCALFISRPSQHVHVQSNVTGPCLNEHCINVASQILSSIDKKVSPCDDFYAFSCNKWIRNNPIPDGKVKWDTFDKLAQQNQLVLKKILEQPLNSFMSEAEKKVKLYYQSCMDEDGIAEQLGAQPFVSLLEEVGGWNVSASGFNVTNWSLERSLKVLKNQYNIDGLFSWTVVENSSNSKRHSIRIDQGGLSLPTREHYLNKTDAHVKEVAAYQNFMERVTMILLGATETEAKRQMEAVLEFEGRLANITVPEDVRVFNLSGLQTMAPFIDWREHFEDAFRQVKLNITDGEVVLVGAPKYLENLTAIVREYISTDEGKTVLANYMVWQMVRSYMAYLPKGLRQKLIGPDKEPRWRYCINDTNSVIGFAIGAMFVREALHNETKAQSESMMNEVRAAFQRNLANLQWMDAETRQLVNETADTITAMIGFPDYILKPSSLDAKYSGLDMVANKYFENHMNVTIFNWRHTLRTLDQPMNKLQWDMLPIKYNAYYAKTKNQMAIPVGMLQSLFYDVLNPKSLNFGGIGMVMGHELTHAFDSGGRMYDKNGKLQRWWNNQTIERFKERTHCFADQYAKYQINGKNLNGNKTLDENIADNGGLKAAFHAYIRSKNESEVDTLPLPALNMTHRQLFFVSFAQSWCSATTEKASNVLIETDTHSLSQFRVIGSLSNLFEFAEEFNCPLGSPMNPVKKCGIW